MKTIDMPYAKIETFAFNGKSYPSEEAAVRAAVEHALGNAGIASSVMRECCTLAPLLARACELGLGTPR